MDALKILGINIKIIVVQIIGFLILYWVLSKFLFRRVKAIITKRREDIAATYERNETERKNAEQLKGEYGRKLSEIRIEAEKIINDGKAIAENVKKEILDKASEETNQLLDKARGQIEREKESAFMDLQEKVADLSVMIASKVIKKTLSQEDHLKLIREHMSKMESYYGKD